MSKKLKPFYNPCPGDIIRDAMEELGWNQSDLAEITGLTGKSVNLIINNKQAITPETATLLGQAFSAPAEMWLNLQARYDLWKISDFGQACSHKPKIGSGASGCPRYFTAFWYYRVAAVFPISEKSYRNHSGSGEKRIGRVWEIVTVFDA